MKCLNLIHRHGKTLLPLLAFFLLPIFSLGFSSESASAITKTLTVGRNTDFCSIDGHNSSCNQIFIYNTKNVFSSTFIDFYPKYMSISSDMTYFYSSSDYFSQCQVFSATIISNCYGQISFNPVGTSFISFENLSSDYFYTYVFVINKDNLPSSNLVTFTFYDSSPFDSPTGSLSITENGTYDVSSYAEAVVEVPDTETIIQGDYHDDLVDIKNIALVAIAVALFICFGRLILGMFMGVRR